MMYCSEGRIAASKAKAHVSNADLMHCIETLKEARGCATMDNASFTNITQPKVTHVIVEEDVTDFIRERCELHHQTWIISPLDGLIDLLQAKLDLRGKPQTPIPKG